MSQALTATGSPQTNVNLRAMVIGAVGVVFGDIGTSPLYSLKECFSPDHGIPFS
ncbi:hypothetical protein GV729_25255, partial [Pseudomonas sp. Fl4BN2]|nr:hypothetical protein [Pseudomonas sp. Fl4BN2]